MEKSQINRTPKQQKSEFVGLTATAAANRRPSTSSNNSQKILKPPRPPAPPLPARRKSLLLNSTIINTTTNNNRIREEQIPERAADQIDYGIKQPNVGTTGLSTSPRMRRFAERLAVIQISLDPPSPPEFALQSPDENQQRAPVPFWAQPGYENYFRPIEDSLLLQVPRLLDQDDADPMRECSPPPRRCSYAST
uniref:Uncharacterized protein n=1 Tax=Meloidogyne hapla TaxID=6305 RepID=A0A1I8BAJ9_MELHA